MTSFVYSQKLQDLFGRITEKDDVETAREGFSDVAEHTVDSDYSEIIEILELGAELGDREFFYIDTDVNGTTMVYLFLSPGLKSYDKNETRLYNQVLRVWCEGTGRTLKKKTKIS